MAGIESVKDLVRPPFANYDIVVYFGCAFFSLPFVFHYIGKPAPAATAMDFGIEPAFVGTVMATLTLLFTVYVIGHLIAYVGSVLIERTMDSWFGKTSSIVALSNAYPGPQSTPVLRAAVRRGIVQSFERSRFVSGAFRALCHLPMAPWYILIYVFGALGFYRTRIEQDVLDRAQTKCNAEKITTAVIGQDVGWFKPLEAVVMNTNAVATARMYNYLVISGLFRSLSTIFLFCAWAELISWLLEWRGYDVWPSMKVFTGWPGNDHMVSYLAFSLIYTFSLFSYLKFQRRYVEEAVFAFVYAK